MLFNTESERRSVDFDLGPPWCDMTWIGGSTNKTPNLNFVGRYFIDDTPTRLYFPDYSGIDAGSNQVTVEVSLI